jgi:ABC-type sugar transport system permease subunit
VFVQERRRLIVPFLAPAALLFLGLFVYPVIRTLFLSLTEWNGISEPAVIGADNYLELSGDRLFANALLHSVMFTLVGGVMLFPPAVLMAWSLYQPIRAKRLFKFMVFLPVVLSISVVSLLWKFIYHPTLGILNGLLEVTGLEALERPWLGDPATALPAVALTLVWANIGSWVILLLAGFERLPGELLEAARIDGADEWTLWRRIILPLLWDVLRILVILWIIQSLQSFAYVFVMTNGGPFGTTEVAATYMYKTAFEGGAFGYAAAMGMGLLGLIAIVTYFCNKLLTRELVEY